MKVTIVDYGLGNLWSVRNAFEFMKVEVVLSSDPVCISESEALVLPGVGSFGSGMQNLHERGLVAALNKAVIGRNVPILGICLGMQLFANESEEAPGVRGLGWIPGTVQKFTHEGLRLPHMGFNAVDSSNKLEDFFNPIEGKAPEFYFVHSYYFNPCESDHILARTTYGKKFISAVRNENIIGVQFHPEKSQSSGLQLIKKFLQFAEKANNA